MIDFRVIWPSYSSTGFNQFNFIQTIWSFSYTWSANLLSIKEYSVAPVSIRNFKCKLEELLATMPSASRGFWAQTSNEFCTKETKEILNDTLNFIASFMKHENFLKCPGHLLRDHCHHCHWSIVPQNLDRRADCQAGTQPPWSELGCWLGALCSLYWNGLAHCISNIHQDMLKQWLSKACSEEAHAKWVPTT